MLSSGSLCFELTREAAITSTDHRFIQQDVTINSGEGKRRHSRFLNIFYQPGGGVFKLLLFICFDILIGCKVMVVNTTGAQ